MSGSFPPLACLNIHQKCFDSEEGALGRDPA
jgi:hypothetical protein